MHDKELRDLLDGQRALDGSVVICRSRVGSAAEREYGKGNVEWYKAELDKQERWCRKMLVTAGTCSADRQLALSGLLELVRVRCVVTTYEADGCKYAKKQQQVLPFKEETDGKEAGSSRRSQSA